MDVYYAVNQGYRVGATEQREIIMKSVKDHLEAEPRGITEEYPDFLEEILEVIRNA